ncbi:FISUMP domain-containing protein, partial [Bacteroidota bacterium]
LEMYLGMSQEAADSIKARGTDEGDKLKEAGNIHWIDHNTGATNSSGFTALPSGYRYPKVGFSFLGESANYWTSTDNENNVPWWRGLGSGASKVFRLGSLNSKTAGQSVRCVKD